MTRPPLVPVLATALLAAAPAAAQGVGNGGCPPGLAKKTPPCVPPGQAKRGYGVGDVYGDPIVIIEDDRLPPLRRGEAWVRVGDSYLRLERETRVILDVVTLLLD